MAKSKAVKKEETPVSNREEHSWGWAETVSETEKSKIKRLFLKKGQRIALQSHQNKDIHWIVLSGFGNFKLEEIERFVGAGAHVSVPKKQKYSMFASKDLEMVEVQMGVCDEKDIRRYEDDYGRA
jgi:mannose-6-phosphate isomerase-like protein (cupin superfamily)